MARRSSLGGSGCWPPAHRSLQPFTCRRPVRVYCHRGLKEVETPFSDRIFQNSVGGFCASDLGRVGGVYTRADFVHQGTWRTV